MFVILDVSIVYLTRIHDMNPAHLMQLDEIVHIAKEFVQLGVNKIRLTGGEPLVRRDAKDIIRALF